MAVTFDLTAVEPDHHALGASSLQEALAARGLRGVLAGDGAGAELVDALPLNGFVMAMHLAYTRHRPLVLSPDAVWLCIAQGLARHVDAHAEALRPRLVRHTGSLALETRQDELARQPSSVALWSTAVQALADGVTRHLGGRADLFVCRFSTTDRCARVASQITLLGAVQSYFEYIVSSLCGIPRITLAGTPNDWRDLRARVRVFDELDLGWWGQQLDPVLAELESTASGKPSKAFWEGAYKVHHASGGEAISGWVNALFPYLGERGAERSTWFDRAARNELELPKLRDYPSGLAGAPFTWRLLEGDRAMRLVAGFVGVARHGDGVAPAIGWAVTPATPERRFRVRALGDRITAQPREAATLRSFDGLADELAAEGHRDVVLVLWWCQALCSLDGLAGIESITPLELMSCDGLDELTPVTAATSIARLRIQQCARLADLRPLARMTWLRELAVNHCPLALVSAPSRRSTSSSCSTCSASRCLPRSAGAT